MKIQIKAFLLAIVLAASIPSIALAQASAGGLFGEATAGQTVTVKGTESGFHREIPVDKNGKYMLRRVPTGIYTVVVTDADGNITMERMVRVVVGTSTYVK